MEPAPAAYRETNVDMVEIDSAPVEGISDETFAAIMDDVVRRRRRPRLAIWLPLMCVAAIMAVAVAQLPPALGGLFILLLLHRSWLECGLTHRVEIRLSPTISMMSFRIDMPTCARRSTN